MSTKNTKLIRYFFYNLLVLLFTSSSLHAQTANITQGCVPLSVNFMAPVGASTFYWDFLDGASSNLQNPSNTFITAGTYVVQFKNTPTGPIVGTVTINVFNKPIPSYTANSVMKGCMPLAVSLSANATLPSGVTVSDYTWTFGEGSSGNGQTVNFVYNTAGTFGISIGLVTNIPSCNNTITYPGVVGVSNPFVNFVTNPNPPVSCTAPLNNVAFTNTTINNGIPMTYAWNMGNGNSYTTTNPPNQNYTSLGNYPVTLTITDTNGCVKSATKPVSLGGPIASFSIPDTICIDDSIQFTNTSTAGFYSWSFGPNALYPTSNSNSPYNAFSTSGLKTIHLNVTAPTGGCSDDTTRIIFVEDPVVTVNAIPQPQCDTNIILTYSAVTSSNIVNYVWNFDFAPTMYTANPTVNYHIWDSTYYKRRKPHLLTGWLVYTTSGGCVDTVFFHDT